MPSVGALRQPGDDGVGDGRLRDRARPLPRPRRARRGRRQVAGRVRVGRQPGAPAAPDARRDAQRRRAAGSRRRRLAATTTCPTSLRTGATRRRVDLGPLRRRLPPRGRAARRRAGRASSPSRSTCRARTSRAGDAIFAHDPELSAEVIAATAALRPPRWAKLSPNTDRIVEVAGAVPRRRRRGGDAASTRCSAWCYDPTTRPPGARRRRRRAVGPGDPPRRRARRARRPRRPPRPADRRRRRRRAAAGTPPSCCSPAPSPSRSARPRSPTPRPAGSPLTSRALGRAPADIAAELTVDVHALIPATGTRRPGTRPSARSG